MRDDNSSYTVTSPDLMLTDDGLNVLICSHDKNFVFTIKKIYESKIDTSIVFNVQRTTTNENNIAWLFYVTSGVDVIVVDLDNCDYADVCTAMTKNPDHGQQVIFISEKNKKRELVRLINAQRKYTILNSLSEFESLLEIQLGM